MRALTLLGSEVTLTTTGNNINLARIVRLVQGAHGEVSLGVILKTGTTTVGTISVTPFEETIIAKGAYDTLQLAQADQDSVGLLAAPVSFF